MQTSPRISIDFNGTHYTIPIVEMGYTSGGAHYLCHQSQTPCTRSFPTDDDYHCNGCHHQGLSSFHQKNGLLDYHADAGKTGKISPEDIVNLSNALQAVITAGQEQGVLLPLHADDTARYAIDIRELSHQVGLPAFSLALGWWTYPDVLSTLTDDEKERLEQNHRPIPPLIFPGVLLACHSTGP